MGIETFWARLIQVLTTETYNVLHGHLLVSGRSQRYETIHYKGDESFIVMYVLRLWSELILSKLE